MAQVCRTCLEEIGDPNYLIVNDSSNNVKEELAVCIPELDLDIIPAAALCIYCASALRAAYDFKQKCLQTEETIRRHMKRSPFIDLEQIKKDTETDSKYDIVHGLGMGMEVIYIRDDEVVDDSEKELIIGDAETEPMRLENSTESVNSFLTLNNDLTPHTFTAGFLNSPNSTIPKNGLGYPTKKKMPTYMKKEAPVLCYTKNFSAHSYKCKQCSFTTTRSFLLKQHVETHNARKDKENVKDCVPKHNGAKYLTCDECDYITSSGFALKQHTLRKHSVKKCVKCVKCTLCSFRTTAKVALYNHMKKHKSLASKNVKIPVKKANQVLKCNSCKFQTFSAKWLKRHEEAHLKKKAKKSPQKNISESPNTPLSNKCPYCKHTTNNKHKLKVHIASHTNEKPYGCNLCKYRANQKSHVDRHMQFHAGRRRWKCNKCSYSVNAEFYLKTHMVVHDDD